MTPGDIELEALHRRHTELDGRVGRSTPLVPSTTRLVAAWLIVLGIFTLIGVLAVVVLFT